MPTLTGSEKQISWAKDILQGPYDLLEKNAKILDKRAAEFDKASLTGHDGDKERAEAAALRAARQRYAQDIAKLPNMAASAIIEKRSGLKIIANNIIADEYQKRKQLNMRKPYKL